MRTMPIQAYYQNYSKVSSCQKSQPAKINAEYCYAIPEFKGKSSLQSTANRDLKHLKTKFKKLMRTNENLKRFNDWLYFKYFPAYSKNPDKFEEFANMKDKNDKYLFDLIGIAELTDASEQYYDEIIKIIHSNWYSKWSKHNGHSSYAVLKIAKLSKDSPDVFTSLEKISADRSEVGYDSAYRCEQIDSYRENPNAFSELALLKDYKGHLLSYSEVCSLVPAYTENSQLIKSLIASKKTWTYIIAEVRKTNKKRKHNV